MAPSIYLTNRNPRVYERPQEFRPERFLGSAPETFSWIPFGGGIRRCIGASFALLEMKLILAHGAQRARAQPAAGARVAQGRVGQPPRDHARAGGGGTGGVAEKAPDSRRMRGRLAAAGVRAGRTMQVRQARRGPGRGEG